jgi:hypothetical protein
MSARSHWKGILGAVVGVALIAASAGTSCTANNLQHYAQETVAVEFAPLVNAIDSKITDGGQINAELLYASYITLFDNNRYSELDKAGVRQRLVPCFYTITQEQVPDVALNGSPIKDDDGKQKYHTETRYHAVTDSGQIFDSIESKFSISINKSKRDYIVQLSETLTNYGSYSIGGNVSAYAAAVSQCCSQYGIPQYAGLVLAVMQQESGGSGSDPMQASECGYNTRFPHSPNSITDPNYSIQCGVQNLASCLRAAKCKSPSDIAGISLALQGYNFGNGFIAWALQRGGYSQSNAATFSQMEAQKMGWSGYGDVNYVSHVLRYYTGGSGTGTGGFSYPIQAGKYTITSGFGYRSGPTAPGSEFHKGIDLAAPAGTPIHAAASGTVIYAQYGVQPYGGYGNLVIVRHSSSLVSMYGHCSRLLVSSGQAVQKGQIISQVGSTGDSTGNHCHFEIRLNGKSVSPMNYLK